MSFAATKPLRTEDLGIGELLCRQIVLEMPAFQRDYAWRATEAERLLDDLVGAMENALTSVEAVPYFLGTMVFVAGDSFRNGYETAQVVDGQQRLVTLTILISALRDLARGSEQATLDARVCIYSKTYPFAFETYRVQPRAPDRTFLQQAVQKQGATRLPRGRAVAAPATVAQRRMEEVREVLLRRLKEETVERRTALAWFLDERCRVLAIWAPDIDYAYQLFLSINKPGLPLTEEDVILAEVVGPLAPRQRRRFEAILAQMSRYRQPRLPGRRQDKTFFTHLGLAQSWGSDRMISRLRRAVARSGGPVRFAREVFEPMASAYAMTRGDRETLELGAEARHWLDGLTLLERFSCDEWVSTAMLLIARTRANDARLTRYLRQLDRFAYVLALTKPLQSERRPIYQRLCTVLREAAELPEPEVLFAIESTQQRAALQRAALKLKNGANGVSKAVLLRLDAHLSKQPLRRYLRLVEAQAFTLEHVLPRGRTLPRLSGWRREFSRAEYRLAVAETIGNLLLVEEERNSDARQLDFGRKKAVFFPNDKPHGLMLTEEVRTVEEWSRLVLEARYARLTNALKELWDLDGAPPSLPDERGRMPKGGKAQSAVADADGTAKPLKPKKKAAAAEPAKAPKLPGRPPAPAAAHRGGLRRG